jgi:hypothetical protein
MALSFNIANVQKIAFQTNYSPNYFWTATPQHRNIWISVIKEYLLFILLYIF